MQVANLPMEEIECIFTIGTDTPTPLSTQVSMDTNTVICTLTEDSLPSNLFTSNGMDCLYVVTVTLCGMVKECCVIKYL